MPENPAYILAIHQGTTGSRASLVGRDGAIVSEAYAEFDQLLPRAGWVEHDPLTIWAGVTDVMSRAVQGRWPEVHAIGITNQRETTVLWSRSTGRPVHHAIVGQDRRTAARCEQLAEQAAFVRERTGLVLDAHFPASKLEWLLQNVPGARQQAVAGDLCFGTIDSWLIWKLTGGRVHVTDFTNASRTMLYNIHERRWDSQLLALFGIPGAVLPEVKNSSELAGHTEPSITGGRAIPIAGIAGDQQAALFGQQGWQMGQAKSTCGAGAALLMNLGPCAVESKHRLVTTLACDERGRPVYALEGSILVAGAAIQWLRDQVGLIASSAECAELARGIPDNGGVYLIPALAGLGAPYWRNDVRGALFGLSRSTGKAHLIRAALEATAYQTAQVLEAMQRDAGVRLTELRTDGAVSRNDWLMQFQADVLGCPVVRARSPEMMSLGAASLAGLASGFWSDPAELQKRITEGHRFLPIRYKEANESYRAWRGHLARLLR